MVVSTRHYTGALILFYCRLQIANTQSPYNELKVPSVKSSCNTCIRDEDSEECVQAIADLCATGFLNSFSCTRFITLNDSDTISMSLNRLCLPPEMFIPNPWSIARFTLWPVLWLLIVWFTFVLSEQTSKTLNRRLKSNLSNEKLGKTTTYFVEIIITTVALSVLILKINWGAIFEKDLWENSDNLTEELFSTLEGLTLCGYSITTLYVMELAWNHDHMQLTLKIHHVCSALFALVGFITVSNVKGDLLPYIRILTFFLLYALSEQSVFLLMLIYRFEQKTSRAIALHSLAFFYIFTRLVILFLEVWSTYVAFLDLSKRPPRDEDLPYCYAFFVVFIPTLLAVSYAQFTSAKIVWGIAKKHRKNLQRTIANIKTTSFRVIIGSQHAVDSGLERMKDSLSSFSSFKVLLREENKENSTIADDDSQDSESSERILV